jgi:hypothetical protein
MVSSIDKIMRRVRGHGRGKWVCTPKDFLDLGSRAAVDRALSRLVKNGFLRRIGRGLYDFPRQSSIMNRPASPNMDAAVDALVRHDKAHDKAKVMPDGIVAANQLGLTNAVPAKTSYLTNGSTRTLKVGSRTVHLRHARHNLMAWANRPGALVVLALDWLGKDATSDPVVVDTLRMKLPDDTKQDLVKGIDSLPSSWMKSIVHKIDLNHSVAA